MQLYLWLVEKKITQFYHNLEDKLESPCEVDPPVEIFELENTLIFIFDSADEIDREQIVNKNTVLQNISKAFLIFFSHVVATKKFIWIVNLIFSYSSGVQNQYYN